MYTVYIIRETRVNINVSQVKFKVHEVSLYQFPLSDVANWTEGQLTQLMS